MDNYVSRTNKETVRTREAIKKNKNIQRLFVIKKNEKENS